MATTPNYSFNAKTNDNFLNFVEVPHFLTPPECDAIIALGKELTEEKATISANRVVDPHYRKGSVAWIECLDSNAWLWYRIDELAQRINNQYYKFDILGFRECMQFTLNDTEGDHYNWHMDYGAGRMSIRKLSLCFQLSDPKDYKGGNLELLYGADPVSAGKERGTAVVFPSYTMHKVTPIAQGKRYSLVSWISSHKSYE